MKNMISLPFFLLRGTTAGAALVTGFLQTFVFAHVLDPRRFSLFILVAAVGYSLWLIDFGIVKILFVRLRERFLAKDATKDMTDAVAGHATAVVLFYAGLVIGGSILCFLFMAAYLATPVQEAAEFGLFFLFVALNLVWFALRNVAIAVDEYVLFEALETFRRFAYFVGLAALYFGLSLMAMLLALNILWAVVLAVCVKRLIQRGALLPRVRGSARALGDFFRKNRQALKGSGLYSVSDICIYNYPYLVVPILFGLGAPPIILDTAFKVSRGCSMVFAAVTDLLVPRQTSALAERDGPTLVRATLIAAALCSVPAVAACAILIFAGDRLFAFLLGGAAVMPAAIVPILIVLIFASMAKMVANSVLVHNGFFREVARIGVAVMAAMAVLGIYTLAVRLDFIPFLQAFAAVYTCGAVASVVMMIRGPIRLAYAGGKSAAAPLQQAPAR